MWLVWKKEYSCLSMFLSGSPHIIKLSQRPHSLEVKCSWKNHNVLFKYPLKIIRYTQLTMSQKCNMFLRVLMAYSHQAKVGLKAKKTQRTRMHSSRIHTAHSSSHPQQGNLPQCMLGYTTPPWVWACRPAPHGCGPGHPQYGPGHPQDLALETSLGVGLETPLGCEPGDPPGQTPQLLPWVWAWRPPMQDMLRYHLQGTLGYHPSCEQNDRQVQKYYLDPNFAFVFAFWT